MKKAKVMLLTIAIIACAGSALAFKVNKLGQTTYCYSETTVQPVKCEEKEIKDASGIPSHAKIYFTVKGTASHCTDLECPNEAEF